MAKAKKRPAGLVLAPERLNGENEMESNVTSARLAVLYQLIEIKA